MPQTASRALFLLLIVLAMSGPISINFYLPMLTEVASSLEVAAASVQLTVSTYLFGFAFAQLILGPLSDRFGRRPILIACYLFFSLASLLCALADNLALLIAARFLQALGGCAGVLISRAIIRDLYASDEVGKMLSILGAGFALAPMIAPILGGVLGVIIGWRGLFLILTGLGLLIVVWVICGCKETNMHRNHQATNVISLIKSYAHLLRARHFFIFMLVNGFAVGGIITFTTGSNFVFVELLGVSPKQYGFIFAFCAFGMFLGSCLSAKLSLRLSSFVLFRYSVYLLAGAGILLAVFPFYQWVTLPTLIIPYFFYTLAMGIVMPNAAALALAPYKKMAGTAAALLGCSQAAFGAACSYSLSLFHDGTVLPFVYLIATMGVASLVASLCTQHIAQCG